MRHPGKSNLYTESQELHKETIKGIKQKRKGEKDQEDLIT